MATDPDTRYSPLHEVHVAAGASFTDFAGWQMPVRYSSDLAEHHAVRTAAGLFDLSHMGEVIVLGPDSAAMLDFALAGKLSAIEEGQAKYSLMLNRAGGIVDDLIVYRTGPDRFLVVANASNRLAVAEELRERAEGFDVVVEDESDDIGLIAVQGPLSLEILQNAEGFEIDPSSDPSGTGFGSVLAELKYYRFVRADFRGHPVLIARTGYTGEDGFELYASPEALPELWQELADTGAGSGLLPAGLASRDTLRLEAGMPLYGHELSLETMPAQAGLGRAVVLSKNGDFIGREAVASAQAPSRVLVGLRAEGKRAGRAEYPVLSDGVVAGTVTSGALSPTLGYPIAMAYIDVGHSELGSSLTIDVRGTQVPVTVVSLPFYSREA